jgi:two-component system OmpR family sensor kinase
VILCAFALVVGSLTVHRIRAEFDREVSGTAEELASQLYFTVGPTGVITIQPPLRELPVPDESVIRLYTENGTLIAQTSAHAPSFGVPRPTTKMIAGYRVVSRSTPERVDAAGTRIGPIVVQYGRRVASIDATVARVELLLVLGTLAGTGLALLAGAMIARRAMAPIARLTSTAEEIARTRDPSRIVPQSDAARGETEAMLARQRRFVADASHELRTPLTSVLANLELLADSLHGEQGEAAGSALRSSRRMRRLVADLLLLARTDVGRVVTREPVDLAGIALEATAELGPLSADHDLSLDVHPAVVQGDHDELLRLTLNLIENALRHTPAGSAIRVYIKDAGGDAVLVVEDDGPGVSSELTPTLFERFVRGAGGAPRRDGVVGGSFGLGLAIVRAVAESHGGSVVLQQADPHGARFVVRLPLASDREAAPPAPRAPALINPA